MRPRQARPFPVFRGWSALELYPGLAIQGNIGGTYRIEYADRLDTNQWSMLATVTLDRTPYLFIDTASNGVTNRLYRAILLP